eukprot:scaffold58227_cov36-Phaeocystis_antarctica.AAC.1
MGREKCRGEYDGGFTLPACFAIAYGLACALPHALSPRGAVRVFRKIRVISRSRAVSTRLYTQHQSSSCRVSSCRPLYSYQRYHSPKTCTPTLAFPIYLVSNALPLDEKRKRSSWLLLGYFGSLTDKWLASISGGKATAYRRALRLKGLEAIFDAYLRRSTDNPALMGAAMCDAHGTDGRTGRASGTTRRRRLRR